VAAVFFIVNGFSVQGVNGRAEAGVLLGLVLAAIFEEIAFRGLFLSVFATRWGFVRANLLQSALFAGIHLQSINPTQVWRAVFLFVLALWLGYFRKKTGSLWPPILLHAAYNLAIALLL
jgi:membrane protease YdiL (CAAX protease family)